MNALTTIDSASISTLTTEEIDATLAYAQAEKSVATRSAYRSDWRDFVAWCEPRSAVPLPAAPGIVCAYLADLAHRGRKASTIGRRAAAITYHHKMAGAEIPAGEAIKAVLRGIRRTIGTAKTGKAAATADIIAKMIALCPADTLTGKRDRALLAFAFAGAFRGSEVAALRVEDLTTVEDGLRVLIRRSKTDQTGEGQEIAIPRGYRLRPVEAVQAWLDAAGITSGPIFRGISKGDRVHPGGLRHRSITAVIKRYATRVGLDPATFAAHSLRSGFLTIAAESGASIWKLSEVSRHRSLDTLRGYVKRVDLFKEHAGSAFL